MKIKFKKLGTIQETELDLRPLTVIIGPNNSNKTYIAYSVYYLWQLIQRNEINPQSLNKLGKHSKKIDTNIWEVKCSDIFVRLIADYLQSIFNHFSSRDLTFFFKDSSGKLFAETDFELLLTPENINQVIALIDFPIKLEFIAGLFRDRIRTNIDFVDDSFVIKYDIHIADVSRKEKSSISELSDLNSGEIIKGILSGLIQRIVDQIFSQKLYPFPSERNTLITIYRMLIHRDYLALKKSRNLILKIDESSDADQPIQKQENIYNPKPVEDFLDFLSSLDMETQRKIKIDSNRKNEFQKLADLIEQQIQNNHKTLLKPTILGGREIKISVSDDLEIDLYNASSSIKQLAPILLYLRYRASKGDFIIIDEPEMNLHPESQAKLLEALAILVNLGVKVLLTTHSPYFMSHLNNLVSGDQDHEDRLDKQANFLYLQDKRAFLPMDKVSAYEMKDNQLVSLKDPDYGIRWDTLSDVSGDIQQKFFEIYEAGEEEENDSEE